MIVVVAKRSSTPITVVIPAYNAEYYLREAVESVNAQSLSVLETIVVDDGSTDGTATIAAKLGTRVIRQDRAGISAARNAAMRAAKGEWIAFLDADDTWMPEKIAQQWQVTEHYPQIGIISCDHCTYEADRVAEPSYLAGLLGNFRPHIDAI